MSFKEETMKFKSSLRNQLILIFSVMIAVALIVVGTVTLILSSHYIRQNAEESMFRIVENVKSTMSLYFEERQLQMQSVANNPQVVGFLKSGENKEIVRQLLRSQFHTYNKFENFFITNSEGFIVVDGNKDKSIGFDIKKYPFWALKTNRKKFHIDEVVYRSPITEMLVTVTAVPIRENGNFLGLLCLPINWESFSNNYLDTVKIGQSGYITVFDTKYTIVTHPDKDFILKGEDYLAKQSSTAGFVQVIKDMKNGFQRYNFNGKWKYMSFGVSEATGFTVIALVDESEFLQGIKTIRNVTIGIGLITLLLGIFLVFWYANTLIKPIKLITEGAERLSVGDTELKGMDIKEMEKTNAREDELGSVGKAFMRLIEFMKDKAAMATEIADGNLTVDVPVSSEKDRLGQSLVVMVDRLRNIVADIRSSSSQVASGSEQLATSAQSMSQGATEQAASVEEITSSMNEISSQIQQNAENGEQANNLAAETSNAAEIGNAQMNEMVSAVEDINQSSQQIAKIIKVIDEIAFQTNLLALNAAVEAARAGKYGKGFAVVAEEVGNLAARSATAAKEITEMIETSVNQVNEGSVIVGKTAGALNEIIGSIGKITDLVGEVAAASKEQALGVNQITEGLAQIEQVTQQNSAHAEESASASEELSGQAVLLKQHINIFKVSLEQGELQPVNGQLDATRQVPNANEPRVDYSRKNDKMFLPDNYGSEQFNNQVPVEHLSAVKTIQLDDCEFGKY